MRYITGIFALNLTCELGTPGDWHRSSMCWNKAVEKGQDSDRSVFKDFGINFNYKIPPYLIQYVHAEIFPVANHLRACLDLLEMGQFDYFQGMRKNFLCTDEFNDILFEKFLLLKNLHNWEKIDTVIEIEFMLKWIKFKKGFLNGK